MNLKELLANVDVLSVNGSTNIEIDSVVFNSKEVVPNSLFVCISGLKKDGHSFAKEVVERGAVALVVQKDLNINGTVTVKVKDTKIALEKLASKFYGNPSDDLFMIGVTGTDGKTTTTYFIESVLKTLGKKHRAHCKYYACPS